MEMFEYVAVLTSIVIGLGIAHLLHGVARLMQHPGREKIYWVHLAWVAYMFELSVFWWWWEFNLREVAQWTFQLYGFVILYAVIIYLLCALLFPDDLEGYAGYRDYFYSRRAWFFGLAALSFAVDFFDSWVKGTEYLLGLGTEYFVQTGLLGALMLVAAVSRNERFHQIFVVAVLIYQTLWALRAFEQVG